jgi:hypothetical protein
MEIFTTLLFIAFSLFISIYLISKGVSGSKKSIDDLKNGKK